MDKRSSSTITPGNGSDAAAPDAFPPGGGELGRTPAPEAVVALAAHQPPRPVARRVLGSLRRAWCAWQRVRRLRRAVRELSSIGVYRLGDVGIPHEQIPEFAEALLERSLAAETIAAFAAAPRPPPPRAGHRAA